MRYRKKPVVIEAIQFTGGNTEELVDFCKCLVGDKNGIYVDTLEGDMLISVGDFLIKGVRGEFYPCKPDIFEATYEVAE